MGFIEKPTNALWLNYPKLCSKKYSDKSLTKSAVHLYKFCSR